MKPMISLENCFCAYQHSHTNPITGIHVEYNKDAIACAIAPDRMDMIHVEICKLCIPLVPRVILNPAHT